MSDVRLSEVKLLHTIQYENKSAGLKFADKALWLASAALGYEDLTLKKEALDDKKEPVFEAVNKVQNLAIRFFIALAAIITLPVALIGLITKACLKNKQNEQIQKIKEKSISSDTNSTSSNSTSSNKSGTQPTQDPSSTSTQSQTQPKPTDLEKEKQLKANDEAARALVLEFAKASKNGTIDPTQFLGRLQEMVKREFSEPKIKEGVQDTIDLIEEQLKREELYKFESETINLMEKLLNDSSKTGKVFANELARLDQLLKSPLLSSKLQAKLPPMRALIDENIKRFVPSSGTVPGSLDDHPGSSGSQTTPVVPNGSVTKPVNKPKPPIVMEPTDPDDHVSTELAKFLELAMKYQNPKMTDAELAKLEEQKKIEVAKLQQPKFVEEMFKLWSEKSKGAKAGFSAKISKDDFAKILNKKPFFVGSMLYLGHDARCFSIMKKTIIAKVQGHDLKAILSDLKKLAKAPNAKPEKDAAPAGEDKEKETAQKAKQQEAVKEILIAIWKYSHPYDLSTDAEIENGLSKKDAHVLEFLTDAPSTFKSCFPKVDDYETQEPDEAEVVEGDKTPESKENKQPIAPPPAPADAVQGLDV